MSFNENKTNRDRESTQAISTRLEEQETDDSSRPHFEDEDYIVFCFREDGSIHVVKDGKAEALDHVDLVNPSSTRHVTGKGMHRENAVKGYNTSHDSMSNEDEREIYPTSEGDFIICNKKEKGKGSMNLDRKLLKGVLRGENHIEEEIEECEMVSSAESRDSNQSDSSSTSFAFPVLSWEGVESPAQMPKPDALQLRNHHHKAARVALLQCFRF